MLKKIIKIIHLPSSVGGNPQGISKHLNKLGLKSQTWVYNQNYLNYPIDKILYIHDSNVDHVSVLGAMGLNL
mgnify:CR=1 FL=1